jgi:hypothetical protein
MTLSVYAKNVNARYVGLAISTTSSNNYGTVEFDLDGAGAVNQTAVVGTGFSIISSSITAVSSGWFRCVAVIQLGSASVSDGRSTIYVSNGVGSFDTRGRVLYTGTSRTLEIWGAQLEQSSTVGEYIPTTSVINSAPRFDHNPTTGESLGLLVEEARTNLVLQSEDLSDSITWVRTNSSVTANAATAPDGTTTADKLIVNSGITSSAARITQTVVKAASAITYTHTIFAKTGESGTGTLQIIFTDTATTANSATSSFSTVSGTITTAASAQGTFTNASSTITAFANGWYRCSLTVTTGTEISIQTRIFSRLPTTGNGTSGLLLWGAQLEAGAFPTSYIPTTTATVTRAADVASITGTNFNSWYNQTEGTVYSTATATSSTSFDSTATAVGIAAFTDGTNAERIRYGALAYSTVWVDNNTSQANLSSGAFTQNQQVNLTSAFKINDFALVRDGGSVQTDATGTLPTLTQVELGRSGVGTGFFTGTIKRLAYWGQRLANTTLQSITAP